MWLAFNDAFVSAVQDRDDPDRLVVRARRQEHLSKLFPDHKVFVTPRADYAARVFVSKTEFAEVVTSRIDGIDYDNFKNSVVDERLHKLYEHFWLLHRQYQNDISTSDRSHHFSWGPNDVQ